VTLSCPRNSSQFKVGHQAASRNKGAVAKRRGSDNPERGRVELRRPDHGPTIRDGFARRQTAANLPAARLPGHGCERRVLPFKLHAAEPPAHSTAHIKELLDGKRIDYPGKASNVTLKRAPLVKTRGPENAELFGGPPVAAKAAVGKARKPARKRARR
jgi:hypothetical protein